MNEPIAAAPTLLSRRRAVPPAQRMIQLAFHRMGDLAPEAAAALAWRLFFTPRRHAMPAREQEWLAAAEPFFLETPAGRLAAWAWGEDAARDFPWDRAALRETVLLVHGWEGRGAQMGAFARPLVHAGFRVVAYDGPAHGRSPGTRTDLPTWAAVLRAVVDELAPVRAVVAHSMGAAATVLALGEGLPVDAAVLLAPPCSIEEVARSFAESTRLPDQAFAAFRRRFEARFGQDAWTRFSGDVVGRRVGTPTLIVHDIDDEEVDVREGERLAAALPSSRLVVTAGLGHRKVLREPAVVDEVVRFLGETPRRAGAHRSRPA